MRKFFKYCFWFIICIVLLMTAGFFIPRQLALYKDCTTDSVSIVIGSNGYHTSFILPVRSRYFNWTSELPEAGKYAYVEFGWGNQRFYMAKDFSIKATVRALFPSATVMHVVYLDSSPETWFREFKGQRITLCKADYLRLIQYIEDSFEVDDKGEKSYLGEGLYGPSSFYKGRGQYHALETCNTWVAKGLRIAGVRTPLWGGTAPAIIWHLKN